MEFSVHSRLPHNLEAYLKNKTNVIETTYLFLFRPGNVLLFLKQFKLGLK